MKQSTQPRLFAGAVAHDPRFRFVERTFGLSIFTQHDRVITVDVGPLRMIVSDASSDDEISFHDARGLVSCVAEKLTRQDIVFAKDRDRVIYVNDVKRAIRKRIRQQHKRLLTKADPVVLAIERELPKNRHRGPIPKDLLAVIDGTPYIRSDIIRFRAAAIAAGRIEWLARESLQLQFRSQPEFLALKESADASNLRITLDPMPDLKLDLTESLRQWPRLFSPTGQSYRSLRRTLTRLPESLPGDLVCELRNVWLTRPIHSRLELITILLVSKLCKVSSIWAEKIERHQRVFDEAAADQIEVAIERVGRFMGTELNHESIPDVERFVEFLLDCPEQHRGNIVGLARRSIRWHRSLQSTRLEEMLKRLGTHDTAIPPASLPTDKEIRFLRNVNEVCKEGMAMRHCVASYAELAVQGQCYLFHVTFEGADATVAVDSSGRVLQSQGPRNKRNKASSWGRRQLEHWGKALLE